MTNDELRKLAEAATPGPWRSVWAPGAMTKMGEHTVQAGPNWVGIGLATQNAAFIAAATPERVIALLDNILALQVELDLVRFELSSLSKTVLADPRFTAELKAENARLRGEA